MDISRYSKLIAAVLASIAAIVADDLLSFNDWAEALLILIPALAVYFAPANTTPEGA